MPAALSTSPTVGMPSARATIATCEFGTALLEHEPTQPLAIVIEQRRRPHGAGDQDGVFRQIFARRRMIAAGELPHQAIGKVIEIVQALAQERIGLPQHTGARVGLHALDRRLRGQSRHHRFFELVHPAAVVGEHPVGFEHLAMLAAFDHIAMFQQLVEIGLQRFNRRIASASIRSGCHRRCSW